jgi:hypothetical protein
LEKVNEELIARRRGELEELAYKEDKDKMYIKKIEENYKQELSFLKGEKDSIIEKSKEFAKNL